MHRRPRESGCGLRDSNGFLKELDAPGLRFPSVAYGNLAVAYGLWPTVYARLQCWIVSVCTITVLAVAHEILAVVYGNLAVVYGTPMVFLRN